MPSHAFSGSLAFTDLKDLVKNGFGSLFAARERDIDWLYWRIQGGM